MAETLITRKFKRLMIAGTGSGCGKTTMVSALLKGFSMRNMKVSPFKVGPDYIDPMFHSKITGTKSRNLDLFLCGENTVREILGENSKNSDIAIIEGVMGFYDGLGFDRVDYSSNDLSNKTKTPVIIVVNARGMALSLAATIKGYLDLSKNLIKGILINGASEGTYPRYKDLIESRLSIKVLGFLPNLPDVAIESRHLGLITADEIKDLDHKLQVLGENALKYIDFDGILDLASEAPELEYYKSEIERVGFARVGIAKDRVFSFYYEDNLDLLSRLGLELVEFSPLEDKTLPKDLDGLIFGGGYPELYKDTLSKNTGLLDSIRRAHKSGMPIYGESGGFMYLGSSIEGEKMVGIIENKSILTDKLGNFGYINLLATRDNILCKKGQTINGHEFHYTKSDFEGEDFTAKKISSGKKRKTIVARDNLFAGYPHLHLWGNIDFGRSFVRACVDYRSKKES